MSHYNDSVPVLAHRRNTYGPRGRARILCTCVLPLHIPAHADLKRVRRQFAYVVTWSDKPAIKVAIPGMDILNYVTRRELEDFEFNEWKHREAEKEAAEKKEAEEAIEAVRRLVQGEPVVPRPTTNATTTKQKKRRSRPPNNAATILAPPPSPPRPAMVLQPSLSTPQKLLATNTEIPDTEMEDYLSDSAPIELQLNREMIHKNGNEGDYTKFLRKKQHALALQSHSSAKPIFQAEGDSKYGCKGADIDDDYSDPDKPPPKRLRGMAFTSRHQKQQYPPQLNSFSSSAHLSVQPQQLSNKPSVREQIRQNFDRVRRANEQIVHHIGNNNTRNSNRNMSTLRQSTLHSFFKKTAVAAETASYGDSYAPPKPKLVSQSRRTLAAQALSSSNPRKTIGISQSASKNAFTLGQSREETPQVRGYCCNNDSVNAMEQDQSEQEEELWEVRRLEGDKIIDGIHYFLVRWKGDWPMDQNPTWEPKENISRKLIQEYLRRKKVERNRAKKKEKREKKEKEKKEKEKKEKEREKKEREEKERKETKGEENERKKATEEEIVEVTEDRVVEVTERVTEDKLIEELIDEVADDITIEEEIEKVPEDRVVKDKDNVIESNVVETTVAENKAIKMKVTEESERENEKNELEKESKNKTENERESKKENERENKRENERENERENKRENERESKRENEREKKGENQTRMKGQEKEKENVYSDCSGDGGLIAMLGKQLGHNQQEVPRDDEIVVNHEEKAFSFEKNEENFIESMGQEIDWRTENNVSFEAPGGEPEYQTLVQSEIAVEEEKQIQEQQQEEATAMILIEERGNEQGCVDAGLEQAWRRMENPVLGEEGAGKWDMPIPAFDFGSVSAPVDDRGDEIMNEKYGKGEGKEKEGKDKVRH